MKLWRIAWMMLAAVFLASCSKDDGDWDPMVWKADTSIQIANGVYDVSADGGTLTFTCKNYSSPWIEYAASGESSYYPPRENNDFHTITADWFKAEIEGRTLSITFETNNGDDVRPLELTVTAGDIFHTFKFKQRAKAHRSAVPM